MLLFKLLLLGSELSLKGLDAGEVLLSFSCKYIKINR